MPCWPAWVPLQPAWLFTEAYNIFATGARYIRVYVSLPVVECRPVYVCVQKAHGHDDYNSDEYMLKCFGTLHYAVPEDYLLYQCIPRDVVGFHKKCADLCIKHKQACTFFFFSPCLVVYNSFVPGGSG